VPNAAVTPALASALRDSGAAETGDAARGLQLARTAGAASGVPGAVLAGAAANRAAINAATSAPNTAGGGTQATNAVQSTDTNATLQVPAAATAAAQVISVAPSFPRGTDSSSSSDDDGELPATGSVAQQTGPTPAPVSLVALPVSTPAAAASAQAALAIANVGAADKHSSGGAGDAPVPDASGSGTAGIVSLGINTTATTAATDATPTPTMKVSAAVDTPEFSQGVADRVSYMVDNNLSGAKLQVNPPQLGPIDVRISVQGDQAQVWLSAHSAVTRDALEASSPKLREMLGAQGFAQVSVDVSQRSFQDSSSRAQSYDWTPPAARSASVAPVTAAATSASRISSGTVDAYA
jgi:flagellar hook-length control protein FliK